MTEQFTVPAPSPIPTTEVSIPVTKAKRRRWVAPLVVVGAALAMGSGAVAYGVTHPELMSGTAVAAPHTHLIGTMEVIDTSGYGLTRTGTTCSGTGGYSDIKAGTTVHIRRDGKLITQAALSAGSSSSYGSCTFTFIADAPVADGVLTWEVSHRGELIVDEAPSGQSTLVFGTIGD